MTAPQLLFEPVEFLEKLAALTPRPEINGENLRTRSAGPAAGPRNQHPPALQRLASRGEPPFTSRAKGQGNPDILAGEGGEVRKDLGLDHPAGKVLEIVIRSSQRRHRD